MIQKFIANITLDIKGTMPETESQWEAFNIRLEELIEQALESNDTVNVTTAEVILEER